MATKVGIGETPLKAYSDYMRKTDPSRAGSSWKRENAKTS